MFIGLLYHFPMLEIKKCCKKDDLIRGNTTKRGVTKRGNTNSRPNVAPFKYFCLLPQDCERFVVKCTRPNCGQEMTVEVLFRNTVSTRQIIWAKYTFTCSVGLPCVQCLTNKSSGIPLIRRLTHDHTLLLPVFRRLIADCTETMGTCQSVRIISVWVLIWLLDIKSRTRVLSIKRPRQTFLWQQNV